MIHDIAPHSFDIGFRRNRPAPDDYIFCFCGDKVLFAEGAPDVMPRHAEIRAALPGIDDSLVYLFSLDGRAFFFAGVDVSELPGFTPREVQELRNFRPTWLAFAVATAAHLAQWYAKNRRCGACGAAMLPKTDERALRCSSCGETVYPRISPAVIVAVTDGDRLLLTRYANRPGARRQALVAGFMEVGETLEDTVRREVMEEVGVRVKNIRYYKSQPWAFSGSVLVGFFADLDGAAELTVDRGELDEAAWVDRDDIPEVDTSVSLTSEMIDLFKRGASPT